MAKLTRPQHELLTSINTCDQYSVAGYRPAEKLVALGLAVWVHHRFSSSLRITPAGRAALTKDT